MRVRGQKDAMGSEGEQWEIFGPMRWGACESGWDKKATQFKVTGRPSFARDSLFTRFLT